MGSILLIGAGSSSSDSSGGGGGPTLDADFEYQKLTPSDFVGKITLGLLGDTHEVDATAGALTAGEMQTELESLVGAGNVEVSIYNGQYYVVKFIEDLAEYNLAQMSLAASESYVPNDDTGTAPSKTSQRDADAEVNAQVVVNLGTGAAGWVLYESAELSGGSVAFSKSLSAAEIDLLLVNAGYPSIIVTKDGSTLTIDNDTSFVNFATVTISGHTGAAVTPAVATLQNGTTATAPTITSSATFDVNEETTSVGTVTVSGGLAPIAYSISGTDSALFTINSSTGALAFLAAPDFEAPGDAGANNVHNITVRATSAATDYTEQSVAVTVLDVAFAPPGDADVGFAVIGDSNCFSDAAGTTPAVENGEVLCVAMTNGLKFSVASASGFTLAKENGEWVLVTDGSKYLRTTTGALSMNGQFVLGMVVKPTGSVSDYRMPIMFGDESNGERRGLFLEETTSYLGFSGYAANVASTTAVTNWASIMATKNGAGLVTIYKDGTSVASGTPSLNAFASDAITLGADNAGAERFIGKIKMIYMKTSVQTAKNKVELDKYAAALVALF